MTEKQRLEHHKASFTFDEAAYREHGLCLYYFAVPDRAPGALVQRRVSAIIDIDAEGRLAGVELIDDAVPPPPHVKDSPTTTAEA